MPVIDPPAPGLLRTLTDVTGYDAAPDGSAPVKSGSVSVMTPVATAAALTAEQSARSAADTTLTTDVASKADASATTAALADKLSKSETGTQTLAGALTLPGDVASGHNTYFNYQGSSRNYIRGDTNFDFGDVAFSSPIIVSQITYSNNNSVIGFVNGNNYLGGQTYFRNPATNSPGVTIDGSAGSLSTTNALTVGGTTHFPNGGTIDQYGQAYGFQFVSATYLFSGSSVQSVTGFTNRNPGQPTILLNNDGQPVLIGASSTTQTGPVIDAALPMLCRYPIGLPVIDITTTPGTYDGQVAVNQANYLLVVWGEAEDTWID